MVCDPVKVGTLSSCFCEYSVSGYRRWKSSLRIPLSFPSSCLRWGLAVCRTVGPFRAFLGSCLRGVKSGGSCNSPFQAPNANARANIVDRANPASAGPPAYLDTYQYRKVPKLEFGVQPWICSAALASSGYSNPLLSYVEVTLGFLRLANCQCQGFFTLLRCLDSWYHCSADSLVAQAQPSPEEKSPMRSKH